MCPPPLDITFLLYLDTNFCQRNYRERFQFLLMRLSVIIGNYYSEKNIIHEVRNCFENGTT
ncbi:hypothetical protein U27_00690 [Candidatus Vecturithrix granuli]|uniref:Uncharacterized protein n=1 Tax=Vecturithrix granuli TaxID=1499967 RepID=A0A081C887_VECG1|nr:hypothetical protein U27_00690 [Candidatus Vecturithrix granuli]